MYRRTPDTPLTDRQQQLLDLLEQDERRSVRELQALANISSTSVVRYNLVVLERMGYITFGPRGHSRSIRVVPLQVCAAGPGNQDVYARIGAELEALAVEHPHNYKAEYSEALEDSFVTDKQGHVQSAERCSEIMNDRDAVRILLRRRAADLSDALDTIATLQAQLARVVELSRFWAAHDPRLAEAIREYEAGQC